MHKALSEILVNLIWSVFSAATKVFSFSGLCPIVTYVFLYFCSTTAIELKNLEAKIQNKLLTNKQTFREI